MKFSHVLLAAPFVAGALAAPAVSQNTKDLPTTEGDCVAAKLVWDGAACAAPACAKGEKLKGGECVKAPKNNNKGKNNKNKNNKGKKPNNNNKGKKPNNNGKKPNKPNKKKPKKPELTEDEKEQKKIDDQLKKEEKEQKKQDKIAEKEELMEARELWALDNACTGEVFGAGTDEKPFVCEDTCGEGMYRGWNENGPMCHDCTADGFAVVTNDAGESKCKKEKPIKEDKPKKDGPKKDNNGKGKGKGNDKKDKITQEEKDQIKQDKIAEKEELMEARDLWAVDNACTGEVFGAGTDEKPFLCEDTCGEGMYRGWNENGPMCHDCTADGFEVVTNDAGESKCKKEKPIKEDKPKKDGPKKDNNGKGKGKGNDKKDKITQEEKDQIKQDKIAEKEELMEARDLWAVDNACTGEVFGAGTDEKPFVCEDTCGEGMYRGWNENGPMCHDCTAAGWEVVTDKAGDEKCKKTKPNKGGDKTGPNNGGGKGPNGDGKGPNGDDKGPNGDGKGPNGDGKGPNGDGKGPNGDGKGPNGDDQGDGKGPNGDGKGPNGDGKGPNGDGKGDGKGPNGGGKGPNGPGNKGK